MIKQGQTPVATYRIQLNKDFTFQDLLPVVDYLSDLGITHLYLSPIFESVSGSNHGYDTLDFTKISAERGGEEGLKALDRKLQAMDPPMKIILDIVPNHMAANTDNPYWFDVLKNGSDSKYWKVFDLRPEHGGKIQIPVLGGTADELLEQGQLKLGVDGHGQPSLCYFDKHYPLSIPSLQALQDQFGQSGGTDLNAFLGALPKNTVREILDAQHYEPVLWSTVKDHVGYRRFFDITDLIGMRIEDPAVFKLSHDRLFDLAKTMPSIDGVRVDHVDGLVDPAAYLKRLSEAFGQVWIEKILGKGEDLFPEWPVKGTTGYEFIPHLNQLMTNGEGFKAIEKGWQERVAPPWKNFAEAVIFGKLLALDQLFPAELKRLAVLSAGSDEAAQKQAALFWRGLTVFLPVYRTYAGENTSLNEDDKNRIRKASAEAEKYFGGDYAKAAGKFLPLLLDPQTDLQKQAKREWQQLSGPAMAKGLEDTAHYNYTPLAALNDVGCEGDLRRNGHKLFFDWAKARARNWPNAMNATSTHDTKRSEDVRARLYALSAIPQAWLDFYDKVRGLNQPLQSPGAAEEYFLYQAILGTWPLDDKITDEYCERIVQYMKKDIKEAKQKTSWLKPDEAYEKNVERFVRDVLSHQPFLDAAKQFAAKLSPLGAVNSLVVQTLKILSLGVPDFYQGTENWDLSLVDPDNRRPVDYKTHAALMNDLAALRQDKGQEALTKRLTESWRDGAIKQWLTQQLLQIRKDRVMPMGALSVKPLRVTGANSDRVLAYCLASANGQGPGIAVMLPRNLDSLAADNSLKLSGEQFRGMNIELDSSMRNASYRDLLSGETKSVEDISAPSRLFSGFPVSVISYEP